MPCIVQHVSSLCGLRAGTLPYWIINTVFGATCVVVWFMENLSPVEDDEFCSISSVPWPRRGRQAVNSVISLWFAQAPGVDMYAESSKPGLFNRMEMNPLSFPFFIGFSRCRYTHVTCPTLTAKPTFTQVEGKNKKGTFTRSSHTAPDSGVLRVHPH